MNENISETLAGQSTTSSLEFLVKQSPVAPWNALIGGRTEAGKHPDVIVEGGVGTRSSILAGVTFRFQPSNTACYLQRRTGTEYCVSSIRSRKGYYHFAGSALNSDCPPQA